MKTWFNFKAKADGADSVEVNIFDEIGMWGVTAKDFISELKNKTAAGAKTVTLSINSPGGSVFDALAIYNSLRASGANIEVRILGVAASAASLIAMAGDKIIMPENSFMMIHNPWAVAAGNADELRDFADTLDTIGSSLVKTYVARTGKSEEEIKELLAAETWLTAQDAVDMGFADEVEPALKVAAMFYADNLPENVKAIFAAAEQDEEGEGEGEGDNEEGEGEGEGDPAAAAEPSFLAEVTEMAKAAGLEAHAKVFALNPAVKSADDAKPLVQAALLVRELCQIADVADLADKLIASSSDLDTARAAICEVLAAKADKQQTDSTQTSGGNGQRFDAKTEYQQSVWGKIFPQQAEQK